ncbi:MAG: hypothetical protein OXF44_02645 [Anaerolineaceae bacterium]|nr:hypothetical protein [Anaerolineaceae bacterium]
MVRNFSQRMGLRPVRTELQKYGMDEALRTRLWNALHNSYFWERDFPEYDNLWPVAKHLWDALLRRPVDTLPETGWDFIRAIRAHYFSCEWDEVYDLIEEVLKTPPRAGTIEEFTTACNRVLSDESSYYRLINNRITPVFSEEGRGAIEDAIKDSPDPVRQQLTQALVVLSDRNSSNYRNSIKDSINAVETLCRQITGKSNVTLGDAVNLITRSGQVSFHPAFAEALKRLYGWTSDEGGIRHGLMDESNLSQEDARFMLVCCSEFINYLTEKADKAGINLRGSNDTSGGDTPRRRSSFYDFAPPPDDFAPPPSDVGEIPF